MAKLEDLTLDENPVSFESSYYQTILDECFYLQTLDHQQIAKIKENITNSKENVTKLEMNECKRAANNATKIPEYKKISSSIDEIETEEISSAQLPLSIQENKKKETMDNLSKLIDNSKFQRILEVSSENRKEEKGISVSPNKEKPSIKEKQKNHKESFHNGQEMKKSSQNSRQYERVEMNHHDDQELDPVVVIKIIEEQYNKEVQRVEVS